MARSKGWQVPLSQMVPAGHWSSRSQARPPLAGAGLVCVLGSGFASGSGARAVSGEALGAGAAVGVDASLDFAGELSGASSACAVWKGSSGFAVGRAKGSRLAAAQTGEGESHVAMHPSVAAKKGRVRRSFFIRARDR